MAKAKVTVATILTKTMAEWGAYLNTYSQIPQCFEKVKEILNREKESLKDPKEADICIRNLESNLKRPQQFLSTLTTWQLGGKYKITNSTNVR